MSQRRRWNERWETVKDDIARLKEMIGEDVIAPFVDEAEFLSNFFTVPGGLKFMGYVVPTAEHAYQMMKTLNQDDRAWIALQPTAYLAKRAGNKNGLNGRKIELRQDWEEVKYEIMKQVVRAKFTQHAGLAKMLLMTGDKPLIELNWWGDDIWGWCSKTWRGTNLLGRILMEIREELRGLQLKGEGR